MTSGHGDDKYLYNNISHNFSHNLLCTPLLDDLYDFLRGRMAEIASYPEPDARSLRKAIARKEQVGEDNILVTAGATAAIYLVAETMGAGTAATIFTPTFSEYGWACQTAGIATEYVARDKWREKVGKGRRLCWLCNPNNPDGYVYKKEELLQTIGDNPDTLFVVDMAYTRQTLQPTPSAQEMASYDNAIALCSMTKQYCIPGLRIGYVVACPATISRLAARMQPWSVSSLAIEAGKYLTANGITFGMSVEEQLSAARRLREDISAIEGYHALPSQTNFFLVRMEAGASPTLKEWLAKNHGILIREASNFRGLDARYFRLSAQTPEENAMLVEALRQYK